MRLALIGQIKCLLSLNPILKGRDRLSTDAKRSKTKRWNASALIFCFGLSLQHERLFVNQLFLTIAAVALLWASTAPFAEIPKIIFDTDMTGDCDDCGALAVLHALADRGEVELLGCIASYGGNPYVAGCIDAINTWYGRGDLPIGAMQEAYGRRESFYLETIAADQVRYGHDVMTKKDVPDHVTVYRQILAKQSDGSVTIVTVGRLKALCDLLASPPDDISSLNGVALVKQKAVQWVCMGGRYPNSERKGEANFQTHGGAGYSKTAVENWPLPAVFLGYEIGARIMTGQSLLNISDDNPVARAYRLYLGSINAEARESWDQTAVLFAVRGATPWWNLVSTGSNHVDEKGVNEWQPSPDKEHAYAVEAAPPEEVAVLIESLMIQPPKAWGESGGKEKTALHEALPPP